MVHKQHDDQGISGYRFIWDYATPPDSEPRVFEAYWKVPNSGPFIPAIPVLADEEPFRGELQWTPDRIRLTSQEQPLSSEESATPGFYLYRQTDNQEKLDLKATPLVSQSPIPESDHKSARWDCQVKALVHVDKTASHQVFLSYQLKNDSLDFQQHTFQFHEPVFLQGVTVDGLYFRVDTTLETYKLPEPVR